MSPSSATLSHFSLTEALRALLAGKKLSREEAYSVMEQLVAGEAPPEQVGAILAALRLRQETSEELVGFASCLRAKGISVSLPETNCIDSCGTGGDHSGSFNVSTTVAFVVAGAGVHVAKHGNRAVSSRSGSFDLLEALGIAACQNPSTAEFSLREHGLAFLFAPAFHPALKTLGPLRKSLGVRTVFNILGPLLNPTGVRRQLIGVFSSSMLEPVARALQELGSEEAMVVHGEDGLDEFTLGGRTFVAHLKNGKVRRKEVSPAELGLKRAPASALAGGDASENARITLAILEGEMGPKRDLVLLNSAGALVVAGRAKNLKEGIALAAQSIDSGEARRKLERLRKKP